MVDVERILVCYEGESLRLLGERLAEAATVDRIMRAAGFARGPFEQVELAGAGARLAAAESLYQRSFQDPRYRPHPILRRIMESGRGFYGLAEAGEPNGEPAGPTGGAQEVGPTAILGEGELAQALRRAASAAGLEVVDEPGRARQGVVAGIGPLEVRRLRLR